MGATGLDIGSETLKLVELEEASLAPRLINVGFLESPAGAMEEGRVVRPEVLAQALRSLFDDHPSVSRQVAVALKGPGLLVRRLEVEASDTEELEELLAWELEQVLPWELEESHFDYHIQSPPGDGGAYELIVAAARKDLLSGIKEALAEAGLEPRVVDHAAFALEATLELCFEVDPERTIALFDLGGSITTIHILRGSRTLAVRDEALGGRFLAEHMARRCEVSPEEARAFLLGQRPQALNRALAEAALQEGAEEVAQRLSEAVGLMGFGPAREPLDVLVLGGGGSMIESLERSLGQKLSAPVELLTPFASLDHEGAPLEAERLLDQAPAFSVAVGLALRGLQEG